MARANGGAVTEPTLELRFTVAELVAVRDVLGAVAQHYDGGPSSLVLDDPLALLRARGYAPTVAEVAGMFERALMVDRRMF